MLIFLETLPTPYCTTVNKMRRINQDETLCHKVRQSLYSNHGHITHAKHYVGNRTIACCKWNNRILKQS